MTSNNHYRPLRTKPHLTLSLHLLSLSLAAFIATDCRPPPPPVPSSLALRVGGSSSSHPPPNNNSNSNTEGEARGKKLLVATLDGRIRVWDLNEGLMVIDATTSDLNPEAAASSGGLGTSVAVAKISSQGLPLIIMSNGGAFCYQPRMKVWMKVWDIQAPLLPHAASPLLPFTLSSNQGDLSTIQTEAQKHQGPVPHSQLMAQASASNAVALMLQARTFLHASCYLLILIICLIGVTQTEARADISRDQYCLVTCSGLLLRIQTMAARVRAATVGRWR